MKRMKSGFIILLTLFLLTGCWNRRELNELVIALAIGIDKTENGYRFSVQLINPTSSSQATKKGAVGPTVRVASAEGETLFEAWRRLTQSTPRKVYFAHVQLLILDEEVVKGGLKSLLDPLIRDHELRNDFYVGVARGSSAEDVISILTILEPIPALSLHSMIASSSDHYGTINSYKFDELLEDLKTDGKELALSGIKVDGDIKAGREMSNTESSNPTTQLNLDNMAVFKDDRFVGWFNENQSKGYNYSQGNIKSTAEVFSCPNDKEGKYSVEVIRVGSKSKASIRKGSPEVVIDIQVEGNLIDAECEVNPVDVKIHSDIEKKLESKVERLVKEAITASQDEFQSDLLGFGSTVHRKEAAYWRENYKKWNDIFPTVKSTVKVTAKIHNTGTLGESLKEGG
ncbi:Ger(x)C family spore germination protein [Bacillus sp. KH172YL63]|uniref:Ger(x)C family spore germination protein n=1 Tax=Bacillus sp. KH172YL63 TaxID=2709784 RepID=UPI0013E5185B|nr:Ger(x)C family spore germination protein [Bacillus sp. KH172YL63]BCB04403.1 spore germination protein KC [Bacillus sp. KH172YL63]